VRNRRLVAALLALTVTATGRARSGGATAPSLTLAPCASEGAMKEASCGSLSVPEDPNQPGGRTIDLRVVVLRALSPTPARPARPGGHIPSPTRSSPRPAAAPPVLVVSGGMDHVTPPDWAAA